MTTRHEPARTAHGPGAGARAPRPTATRSRRPGWRNAASTAPLVLAVLLAVLLSACSTAKRRESPEGPRSLLTFRDAATAAYFADSYRSGNLYLDFRPALVVDAIVRDRTYRRLFVDMLQTQFLLPEAEVEAMRAQQQREFETEVSILLFTYEGTNKPVLLTREDTPWRILLRDDDGQLQRPTAISRIRPESQIYLYVDKYFSGLDRWSEAYLLTFPKLSKGLLGRPPGPNPVQLIVTGIKGTVVLQWDDPGIFYQSSGTTGARDEARTKPHTDRALPAMPTSRAARSGAPALGPVMDFG